MPQKLPQSHYTQPQTQPKLTDRSGSNYNRFRCGLGPSTRIANSRKYTDGSWNGSDTTAISPDPGWMVPDGSRWFHQILAWLHRPHFFHEAQDDLTSCRVYFFFFSNYIAVVNFTTLNDTTNTMFNLIELFNLVKKIILKSQCLHCSKLKLPKLHWGPPTISKNE